MLSHHWHSHQIFFFLRIIRFSQNIGSISILVAISLDEIIADVNPSSLLKKKKWDPSIDLWQHQYACLLIVKFY